MHATKDGMPILLEAGPAQLRGVDWNGIRVAVVSVPAGTDFGPLLQGLPGDRCPGNHWGYVIRGRLRITHADGQVETLQGGDYYHMPAGHTGVAEDDTEFIEVGEPGPHQQFIDNAKRNLAAMTGTGQ